MMRLLKQLLKDQRGAGTLTMALIGLLLSSMLVVSYLSNLQTQLIGVSKADSTLKSSSSAEAGIEHAIWRILNEPGFTDSLTPSSPTATYDVTINGETVPITITKMYPDGYTDPPTFTPDSEVEVTKTVTPITVASGVPTDYTYTISLENIGYDNVEINGVTDELPQGLTYKGPTTGMFTDDPIVQNIAGRQVLRWNPPEATWETNADDISLGAAQLDQWTDIDLSPYVPVGTTGVVVEIINDANSNTHRGMLRGTEDTRDYMAGSNDGSLYNQTHRWQIVKVDSASKIQGYSNSTDILFKLLGRFTSSDPKFFANPPEITPTTAGSWTTVDVTSLVDADADGVILLVYSASDADVNYGIREIGSTDHGASPARGLRRHTNTMYLVGLDTGDANSNTITKEFGAFIESTEMKIYLVAQTKGSIVFYQNDIAVTDTPTGSWRSLDADDYGVHLQAGGLVFRVESPLKKRISFRHGDGSDDWGQVGGKVDNQSHIQAMIGLGPDNQWDEWMEKDTTDVYIAAYIKGRVPVVPQETKTLTFVVTGSLDSGTYTNQAAYELLGGPPGACRATALTATITVGAGGADPDKIMRVDKSVVADQGVGFQLETYTYTITATNITTGPSVTINDVIDILPRFWNYEAGSSLLNGSPIADPAINLDPPADPDNDQQTLQWTVSQAFNGGDTLTLQFQASASVDKGDYDNEALVNTDNDFFPCVSSGKTARINVSANYDILVTAGDITVAVRIQETSDGVIIDSIQYQ